MSIFKRILGGNSSKIITADLKRLNETRSGMGDAAVKFVLTGEPITVLSTLSIHGGGENLDICGATFWRPDRSDIYAKRPGVFLDFAAGEIDMVVRYAEALAASCKTMPGNVLGSDKVPAPMRILFSEAFLGARATGGRWPPEVRKEPIKGLTADRLFEVARACGGTSADLFEMLFWTGNYYDPVHSKHFRKLTDLAPLVRDNAEAALEGAGRCSASGREAFIEALMEWNMVGEAPFLGAVLEQAGDSAKAVRELAVRALRGVSGEVIEPMATEHLSKGKVAIRAGMVEVLVALGTDTATAALRNHARTEKTARIVAAIENALSVPAAASDGDQSPDDATGYTAIDGSRVEVPPVRPLKTGPEVKVTLGERKAFAKVIAEENEKIARWNETNKGEKWFRKRTQMKSGFVETLARFLEGETLKAADRQQATMFLNNKASDVARQVIGRMTDEQAMRLSFETMYNPSAWMSRFSNGYILLEAPGNYLSSPEADVREIERVWREMKLELHLGGWRSKTVREAIRGDLLRAAIPADAYYGADPSDVPAEAFWPYLAENFDVLDGAFGIGQGDEIALDRVRAVSCVATMPKVPMRYFGALLEIATGERKSGKAEARQLLMDVPEVGDRLVALLGDSRQAVRAGAAEWMGTRGDASAIKPLKARLKKEKSELAKAAILTALQALGESLDDFVGPAALIREAEAGLKKAKFTKLDWLAFDAMPALKFKSGKPVPGEVPRWWVFLANKLKQPGGNALFEIFLDQLDPKSAASLSGWVLDSWLTYDTTVCSDEEANAHAEKYADGRLQSYIRWVKDYTREKAFADLRREKKGEYLNSGAATKGILALASRTPPQVAADRVRAYLRNHGSRTSQASSLLDMLANKGDPVSLQVVIAAATRLKQKGVQAHAGELVQAVADRMNWTMDELGDRVIPTAGLDDEGHLDLPCGPDEKLYRATLGEDFTFVLQNPDGKVVKALSSGTDEATKASKKQFSASKKELKQVVSMQTARLYEALCGERTWATQDWQRDFRDHPVMRRLTERIVWQGLDGDGTPVTSFRPTAEGEYTDAEDGEVDPSTFSAIRIAHGAMMDDAEASAWEAHLKDYEVKPLFIQFGRTLMRLPDDTAEKSLIEDRKGFVLETFQLRGIATKLGYERGPTEDGGWFYTYLKPFKGSGLTAVIQFTGNYLPEENRNCALISLGFEKEGRRMGQAATLGEVPEVLLSECWNDLHAMAAKAAFDKDWEKSCQW